MDEKEWVLVVDDDKDIAEAVRIYLTAEHYRVEIAYDGLQALRKLQENPEIRLILMDIMMPHMDGISATLRIREERNLPILMLTAKSEDSDLVQGLEAGADDYIIKPFSPVELLARVRSALRRYTLLGGAQKADSVIRVGGLELDTVSKTVSVDGEPMKLTATEYGILEYLMNNVGRVLSIDDIYRKVWHEEPVGAENTVAVHIRRIREKIEINPSNPRYIRVVWGLGYVMNEGGKR